MHDERLRWQQPRRHDQVPATHNERRCGQRPGAKVKYTRCIKSGAAGNGLGTAIKYLRAAAGIDLGTAIEYLRGATCIGLGITVKYLRGTADIGLGTTIKYLRRTTSAAGNSGLGTTAKYILNQNAGAGNNWAKAHMHKNWAKIRMPPRKVWRLL
jgi:hypothetical protein